MGGGGGKVVRRLAEWTVSYQLSPTSEGRVGDRGEGGFEPMLNVHLPIAPLTW